MLKRYMPGEEVRDVSVVDGEVEVFHDVVREEPGVRKFVGEA